jgi:hypothetical protein
MSKSLLDEGGAIAVVAESLLDAGTAVDVEAVVRLVTFGAGVVVGNGSVQRLWNVVSMFAVLSISGHIPLQTQADVEVIFGFASSVFVQPSVLSAGALIVYTKSGWELAVVNTAQWYCAQVDAEVYPACPILLMASTGLVLSLIILLHPLSKLAFAKAEYTLSLVSFAFVL